MRYYFICNWKMQPTNFGKAKSLLGDYNKAFAPNKKERWINKKIIICPSFLYFQLFDESRKRSIHLGAQDVFWKNKGSYTGQISAKMIKEFGAEYVIIGHSDLREAGDNEFLIREKIREVLKINLTPIVCIGHGDYTKEVMNIVNSFLSEDVGKMIFAYEPISAIGSGNPADPEKVSQVIRNIKRIIYKKFRRSALSGFFGLGGRKDSIPHPAILYGGSVNLANYKKYLKIADLGGFMIGRESLNPENVKEIAEGFGG